MNDKTKVERLENKLLEKKSLSVELKKENRFLKKKLAEVGYNLKFIKEFIEHFEEYI